MISYLSTPVCPHCKRANDVTVMDLIKPQAVIRSTYPLKCNICLVTFFIVKVSATDYEVVV